MHKPSDDFKFIKRYLPSRPRHHKAENCKVATSHTNWKVPALSADLVENDVLLYSVVELAQNEGQPGINFPSNIFSITESEILHRI